MPTISNNPKIYFWFYFDCQQECHQSYQVINKVFKHSFHCCWIFTEILHRNKGLGSAWWGESGNSTTAEHVFGVFSLELTSPGWLWWPSKALSASSPNPFSEPNSAFLEKGESHCLYFYIQEISWYLGLEEIHAWKGEGTRKLDMWTTTETPLITTVLFFLKCF